MNRRLGPLLLVSLFCASMWAQGPPPLQGLRRVPIGSDPGDPAVNPAAMAPAGDADQVRLQFPNTDIQQVLKLYEQLTGKRVVTDNSVAGVVNIDISRPVGREEAIRIIETNLNLNGYSLVPAEGNMVKVIGAGKSPRDYGIDIYSDVSQIPETVGVVSVVFQLQYADAKDIKAIVDQYLAPGGAYTSTVALPGAIIVTESSVMLRNIAKIIAAADVPPAEVVSRFYNLQRANAKDVLETLTKLFEQSPNAAPANQAARPILPNGQPAPPGSVTLPAAATGLSEDSVIIGKIRVDADIRTNRIHVVTRPVNLPFLDELIGEYDSDIQFGQPVKRPLKYVDAGDILGVIVKAITEPGETPQGDTGEAASKTTQTANTPTNGGDIGGQNGGTGGAGGGLNITEELSTPEKDITPKAVIIGSTKIIADPRENTIIVLGNDEVRRKIFTLLDQLDVRAPQVMLNTVIGEYTLNNDSNLGVDYLLHYPSGPLANLIAASGSGGSTLPTSGFLAGNRGAAVTQFTGTPLSTNLGTALGAGNGFTAAIGAANSLDVIVNALESTGRFHVTNRPMVYTSNNKKAIIVSGQQIPIPTNTLSNLTSTGAATSTAAVASSIDYLTVALQLEVVPLINSDREVNLDILQKLDSPSGTTTSVGGNNVPTISTRYIRTNVSVPNKATIVLGGLITKTMGGSTSAIPFLGRIPVIGYLFGNKVKQSDRSELIILIRPVVTTSPNEMADESHVERKRLLMEPDIESTIAAPTPRPAKRINFRYEDAKQVQ